MTSPSGLALAGELPDVTIIAGFPLPVANSLAVAELQELGVSGVQAWLELDKSALLALLEKSPLPLEICRRGRPALLVTRAGIPVTGAINDGRKLEFEVVKEQDSGLTLVFSSQELELPEIPGANEFNDFTRGDFRGKNVSSFNFNYDWK